VGQHSGPDRRGAVGAADVAQHGRVRCAVQSAGDHGGRAVHVSGHDAAFEASLRWWVHAPDQGWQGLGLKLGVRVH